MCVNHNSHLLQTQASEVIVSPKSTAAANTLPYLLKDEVKDAQLRTGQIVYQPDQGDDIDAEDPDDDLDI